MRSTVVYRLIHAHYNTPHPKLSLNFEDHETVVPLCFQILNLHYFAVFPRQLCIEACFSRKLDRLSLAAGSGFGMTSVFVFLYLQRLVLERASPTVRRKNGNKKSGRGNNL